MAAASTATAPVFKLGGNDFPLITKDLPADHAVIHPVPEVVTDFDTKRAQGEGFDATIIVGDRRLDSHKNLLISRIPFFDALFNTDLVESKTGQVTITQFDATSIESLLDYAYTGKITISEANVQDLTMAANFWQMDSVTDECTDFMRKRLRVANALPIQHICRAIVHAKAAHHVDGFIDANFVPISHLPEFLQLSVEELDGFLHRNSLNVDDERQVFEALTRWMGTDENKAKHGARLLRAVRCTRLPFSYLTDVIEQTPWVAANPDCIALVTEAKKYISRDGQLPAVNPAERVCYQAHRLIMPVGGIANINNPKPSPMSAYDPIADEWKPCRELLNARHRNGVAAIYPMVYCIGGYDGKERLSTCETFNVETNELSKIAEMPSKRSAMAIGVIDGKIYVAGGYDGTVAMETVMVYDPSANTWTDLEPLSKLRGAPASCVYNGKLYVFGGHDGNQIWLDGECYDPAANKWSPIAPMNKEKRCRFGAAVLNGMIYVVGGFDGAAFLKKVERYDPTTNTWTVLKDMKDRRSRATLEVSCGKLYVFGGFDGLNNLNSVEMYQPETDSWQSRKPMPSHSGGVFCCAVRVPASYASPVANLEENDVCPEQTE